MKELTGFDLFDSQHTISVLVDAFEELSELLDFVLRQLRCDEGECRLLELVVVLEVLQRTKVQVQIEFLQVHLHPRMVQSLWGSESDRRLADHLLDEVFGRVGNSLELWNVKGEDSFLHRFQDLGVGVAVEGRYTRKQDIQNDSCGPDVALLVVVTRQNLRTNVIGLEKA